MPSEQRGWPIGDRVVSRSTSYSVSESQSVWFVSETELETTGEPRPYRPLVIRSFTCAEDTHPRICRCASYWATQLAEDLGATKIIAEFSDGSRRVLYGGAEG